MVPHVENMDQFTQILKEAGDKLVVVDFTASWCGPCKQIGPEFEKLATLAENKNVIFLKVDVDDAQDVASELDVRAMPTFIFFKNGAQDVSEHCGIQCMPTFMFYKNGSKVFEFSGANKDTLNAKVEELRT